MAKIKKDEKKPITVIATRNFRNTHPDIIKLSDAKHPDHVHKGAKFVLNLEDKEHLKLAYALDACGSLIDAEDEESVKRLNAEMEEERQVIANDAARAEALARDPVAQLQKALSQLLQGAPNAVRR